ncbi:hypothetical protein OTU49_000291 [Cherax quadricarinatus]|uniref:Uncharacterized protein n=2 Tax=Cherax quadricarinatus TaxID=27406 RepID=A0AAW0Y1Y0_CHEQU
MEKSCWRSLRVSGSELEQVVQQERNKWKIFRIQQVREQAKEEARRIRESVHSKKSQMIQDLRQDLYQQWQAEKENQVQELQKEYKESLQALGKAHELASQQPDVNEILAQRAHCNQEKAARRGDEAKKVHKQQQLQKNHEKNKLLKHRHDALNWEKLRAHRVANLPTPKALKKKTFVKEKEVPRVQYHEAGTFTTTSYHPKNVIIEKELMSAKPNAKQAAVAEEMARLASEDAKRKEAEEDNRKREQRGKEALTRERLCRMYQQLMSQLDQAQHDHQLSTYLTGTDISAYKTKESRLKHQASLQKQMEKAVEKILRDDTSPTEVIYQDHIQLSSDSSGLLEVSDTSRVTSGQEDSGTEVQDMKSLLDRIRQQRRDILKSIYGVIPEEEEGSEEVFGKDDKPFDEHKTELVRRGVESDADHPQAEIISQHEDVVHSGDNSEEKYRYRKLRPHTAKDRDIHMAETVPVHLVTDYHDRRFISKEASAKHSIQDSNSGDKEITVDERVDEGSVETQTSDDEHVIPLSPIIHPFTRDKFPAEQSGFETSSTEYLKPPSTLPSETQRQRQYINSTPFSRDDQDIHMAETVPVNLLPGYDDVRSTTIPKKNASQPTSSEESSLDDIIMKIKSDGHRSSLETFTPSEEESSKSLSFISAHLLPDKHLIDYSNSGISTTDYISPPSSLPKTKVSGSSLDDDLRRIQQQRESIQHKLDLLSDTANQHSGQNAYFEKLKEEGSGKRPLRRKDKFEMQRKEIIHCYLRKLMHLKGPELENMSALTVEGSGFTLSSLNTLVDSLQEKDESVFTVSSPNPSSSVRELAESNNNSSYKDIDDVPVKLSSLSSENKYSCSDEEENSLISKPQQVDRLMHTLSVTHSKDESGRVNGFPGYLQLSRKTSPHIVLPLDSQYEESGSLLSSRSGNSIKKELQKLDHLRKELITDTSSSFLSIGPEVMGTSPTTNSINKQDQKLSFRSTQKTDLSTIYEDSSNLSDSNFNMSGSANYHTPSRENESSLDDAGSQISLIQKQNLRTWSKSSGTTSASDVSSSEEAATEDDRKKFTYMHTKRTYQSRFQHFKYTTLKGRLKTLTQDYQGSDDGNLVPPFLMTETPKNNMRSISSLPATESTPLEVQGRSICIPGTEGLEQEHILPLTADTSSYFPLALSSTTLTSSVEDLSLIHQSPYSRKDDQDKVSYKVLSISSDEQDAKPKSDISSDSSTSMPDMAVILQRFGLDWAQSMMHKMEIAEQKSSSDSSSRQEK